jgi:hypothetical protein
MFHHFLSFASEGAGSLWTFITVVVAAAGTVLWLAGARFSRSLVTLTTVTVGAAIGLQLPRWLGLPIGTWATAIAGALAFGVAGWGMHKTWVGAGLGVVMAFWGIAIAWIVFGPANEYAWPTPGQDAAFLDHLGIIWTSFPASFRWAGPLGFVLGVMTGAAVAWKHKKFTPMLLYSMLGVTLMIIFGISAMEAGMPTMLAIVPSQRSVQVATLVLMVAFGTAVQYRWSARPAAGDDGGEHR